MRVKLSAEEVQVDIAQWLASRSAAFYAWVCTAVLCIYALLSIICRSRTKRQCKNV